MLKSQQELRKFLNRKVEEYNQPSFIAQDPISIPHQFGRKQDIEIAGFFAAMFSWGNRTTIIRKSNELLNRMDNAPFDFIKHHEPADLKKLIGFKHRTFNSTDLLYFIQFLRSHYDGTDSLESAFMPEDLIKKPNRSVEHEFVKSALTVFYTRFFSLQDAPQRTEKHIASPAKNSTCKRLNMYLRWMVRDDHQGVDFGIWKKFSSAELICPVDLHVARVARRFGMIQRKQTDWKTAMELTNALREMDKSDPVKYDFALFSLGVTEKF